MQDKLNTLNVLLPATNAAKDSTNAANKDMPAEKSLEEFKIARELGLNHGIRKQYAARKINLPFDQLIDENKYSCVHISHKKEGNRGHILHLF